MTEFGSIQPNSFADDFDVAAGLHPDCATGAQGDRLGCEFEMPGDFDALIGSRQADDRAGGTGHRTCRGQAHRGPLYIKHLQHI